jgi:hypothetical protein
MDASVRMVPSKSITNRASVFGALRRDACCIRTMDKRHLFGFDLRTLFVPACRPRARGRPSDISAIHRYGNSCDGEFRCTSEPGSRKDAGYLRSAPHIPSPLFHVRHAPSPISNLQGGAGFAGGVLKPMGLYRRSNANRSRCHWPTYPLQERWICRPWRMR